MCRGGLAWVSRRVAGADPAVEAGIESAGRAAVPGEEGMAEVGKRLERGGAKHHVRHRRTLAARRAGVKCTREPRRIRPPPLLSRIRPPARRYAGAAAS